MRTKTEVERIAVKCKECGKWTWCDVVVTAEIADLKVTGTAKVVKDDIEEPKE